MMSAFVMVFRIQHMSQMHERKESDFHLDLEKVWCTCKSIIEIDHNYQYGFEKLNTMCNFTEVGMALASFGIVY